MLRLYRSAWNPRGLSAAQKSRYFFQRTLRRRQSNALQPMPTKLFQPLQRQRQMRAALGRNQRVDLIDDYRFDIAQRLARIRSQQEVE